MIFASVNSQTVYNVGATAFLVIGSLTFLLTYLRGSVNKANRDIDQNTINSLKENNDAMKADLELWKSRALHAEGENKVLKDTVTAAPEIAKLAVQTATQHKEAIKLQNTLINEFKKFVTTHEKIMKEQGRA